MTSIRSYVEYAGITRERKDGKGNGRIRRLTPKKRMTVELLDPFVYPSLPEDRAPYVFLLFVFVFFFFFF